MLLLALAKKSEPERMTGDSNIWVTVLLSDRELFTRRFSVGIELLLLVYLKCAFPFLPLFPKGVFKLFQNVWTSSIYRAMEDVFCQFPGSAALREFQWSQKKTAAILLILFGEHFLTHPPAAQSSGSLHWCLQGHLGISSDPIPLLFLFSLLCYSILSFQLDKNADGHMSL